MAYRPEPVPISPQDFRAYLDRELSRIAFELNEPNPRSLRLQRSELEPPRPGDGDIFYFPSIGGFDPGNGFGLYWHDGNRYRLIAGLDEAAILGGTADNVVVLDPPDFVPIVNYSLSTGSPGMTVDELLGTITLPAIEGFVSFNIFLQINQVTAFKDVTVLGYLEVDGTPGEAFGSAYIPQQSSDIMLFLNGGFSRPVAGGEVLRIVLQLDGATTATFEVLSTSVEISYKADLAIGGGAGAGSFPAGVLP